MATLTRDIIRRAMRLMGVLRGGQQPTEPDAVDALETLQSLILNMPGLGENVLWRDKIIDAAYTAWPGQRIAVNPPGAVTLPLTISETGFGWDWGPEWGCGPRPPLDLSRVMIQGDVDNAGLWIYSATKKAWTAADNLETGSEMPFGSEDDIGIASQLAVELNPEYGSQLDPRTLARASQSARSIKARFYKAAPFDYSRPNNRYEGFRDYVPGGWF